MTTKAKLANSLTKGVLDPALSERIDLPHYYNGLESALNIECYPQGGARRRPGSTIGKTRLRRRVQPLRLTGAMVTAPSGGAKASLVDQSQATRMLTDPIAGAQFVVAEVDFGEPQTVVFADVLGFACETGRFVNVLAVEWDDNGTWRRFGVDKYAARKSIASGIRTVKLSEDNVSSKASDEDTAVFFAPFAGRVLSMKSTLDGPLADANAVLRLDIEGVDVPGGVITITQAGSAAGDEDTATPTSGNAFDVGDIIRVRVEGGSTAINTLDLELTVEQAQETRSRRWSLPPGQAVTAQRWRVVVYGAAGAGAFSVAGLRFWEEKRQLSPVKGRSFARTAGVVYELIVTDRNVDVFRDQVFVSSVPIDVASFQVKELTYTQSLDTALLYHADVRSVRVQRQGSGDEWDGQGITYSKMPALSSAGAYTGNQDEVQEVSAPGLLAGQRFVLWLEGAVTAPVTYAPATLAADVKAALEAIGVPTDVTVERLDRPVPAFRVDFVGNAGSRRWPTLDLVCLDADNVEAVTETLQHGTDVTAPVASELTGFPRCGLLYQSRHLVAGFRSAPITFGVSRYGEAFNFIDDGDPFTADLGFFGTLDTDVVETIRDVSAGRHIQFYTEEGEWWMEARTLDATQPNNVFLATRNGIEPGLPLVMVDGRTIFIQAGGRVMRAFKFEDIEQSYNAEALSLLGPHLLTGAVDMGYRLVRSTDEGNHLYVVNADGTIAFMALLSEQEVVAMTPWESAEDGKYRAAFGDVLNRVWLVVEHETTRYGADLYLEKLDGSHTLDGAVRYAGGEAVDTVSGLEHFEGRDVWAWADRDLVGPVRVTNGTVKLPVAAVDIYVGGFPRLRGRLPRLRERLQNGEPWRAPVRVYELELALAGTGDLSVAVNGGPFRQVPLSFTDQALDIGAEPPRDVSGGRDGTAENLLESMVRALVMIPGSGEFIYGTTEVTRSHVAFEDESENRRTEYDATDFAVSMGEARKALPRLKNVALFTSWFGSDLRAGSCQVRPKVDQLAADLSWAPYEWSVQGLTRGQVQRVSLIDGQPAYGGTPADRSIVEAIREVRNKGQQVTLTPFLVMDVPSANALPNPYGGVGQPAYPWRGRITCYPAPGQPGTPDLTAAAAAQIDAFVGTCTPAHFSIAGDAVAYSGPANEWSYRRFILHYAALAAAAGGVETFVIGSEMRGVSWVRDALGSYPFVDALVQLASDVKTLLPNAKVTYAADWSEFTPHQSGVPGEIYFHLDPLWASGSIDAIGIDNYWPMSDWRDGEEHADMVAGTRSIYDRNYLQANIQGGEGYDWYYASLADRNNQVRTPITDGAYGKPWVYRYKDIKSWWLNAHYDRPGGVESGTATAWVPQSKPIWFMEVGCPAIDKGANQPNVFYDPKSSESFFPYYSGGWRDDRMQRAFLEALLGFWTPGQTGFDEAANPVSSVYGGRMLDVERVYLYCWDARPYPYFPFFTSLWADSPLWVLGHWLTGRLQATGSLDGDAVPVGLSPDLPLRDRLVTGHIRMTNLRGFSRHPTIEFSQSTPAPLELRAIRYEVAHG